MPLPRSTTPAEPTTPRLLTVSSMLPPHFPRRRLQRLMNFGALSRGFGTCCLRFKNDVATIPARLTSGWLARLCREGVDPLDRCKRFQVIHPPFLDLAWRKGSFIGVFLPDCLYCTPANKRGRAMREWLDRTTDGLSVMPADGISLPRRRGDFGTSRWAGSRARLHQPGDRAEGGMIACGTFLPFSTTVH